MKLYVLNDYDFNSEYVFSTLEKAKKFAIKISSSELSCTIQIIEVELDSTEGAIKTYQVYE